MREFFSILKQHTTRGFIPLLRMLVALSCYLPSVPLFTDTQLLPKWYLFVLGSALYVLCLGLSKRSRREKACNFYLHRWFPVLVGNQYDIRRQLLQHTVFGFLHIDCVSQIKLIHFLGRAIVQGLSVGDLHLDKICHNTLIFDD